MFTRTQTPGRGLGIFGVKCENQTTMKANLDAVAGRAVETALSIGLIKCLERGETDLSTLVEALSVSERGLRPLVYLLSSIGLLEETSGRVKLTDTGRDFLDKTWPAVKSELPRLEDWERLETAVRTGCCVRPAIEGLSDAGDFFSGVVETLFKLHASLAGFVAEKLPPGLSPVLDLGAGSAVWSLHYLKKSLESRAVAVDHAKVLHQVTARFLSEHTLEQRYELRAGSYHEVDLESECYELIFLGHVIHSEGREASLSLLKRCRETLKTGGRLIIAEWVGSEPRSLDYHANLFDLNMLMFTEKGLVFTAAEMEALCREAGLKPEGWLKGPAQYPVLSALRAGP